MMDRSPMTCGPKELIDFWNGCASYFDRLAAPASLNSEHRRAALSFVPPGSRVLDLACGNCANALGLEEKTRYFGIDLSRLALGRPLGKDGGRLIRGDGHFLPCRTDSFDAVLSTFALEHFFHPPLVLREIHRVVRPGGRIILLGPCWDLPYWFPPAVEKRMSRWIPRFRYALGRWAGQMAGWVAGRWPFYRIDRPQALAGGGRSDEDAVYVVWSYEVQRFMASLGSKCIHVAFDEMFSGRNFLSSLIKRAFYLLPIYRCGGAFLLVCDKPLSLKERPGTDLSAGGAVCES